MAVRLLKDPEFHHWARKEGLSDEMLRRAATEIESGLVDARLGGFLLKKRVARPGQGKRSGYRTILAHREGQRLVFLHGFAKSEADNVTKNEKLALQALGDEYMRYTDRQITQIVSEGGLVEVIR